MTPLLLVAACAGPAPMKDSPTPTETGRGDSGVLVDTVDSGETADSGDTVDSGDSATETGETADSGEPVDTSIPFADDVAAAKIVGEEADDKLGFLARLPNGQALLAVGSENNNRGGTDGGAIFIFDAAPPGTVSAGDASAILTAGELEYLGWRFSGGDFDGDGVGDLVVNSSYCSVPGDAAGYEGRAYIAYGPFTGEIDLEATAAIVQGPFSLQAEFAHPVGLSVGAAGDTNGDGFDDVLISGPEDTEVFLMTGPVEGHHFADADAAMRFVDTSAGEIEQTTSAGDVDGDGLGDVAIGRLTTEDDRVLVFNGPLSGELSQADADASFQSTVSYGAGACPVVSAGDLDGDGYDDLAIASYIGSTDATLGVYLEPGPVSGVQSLTLAPVALVSRPGEVFGEALALAGDVDADGSADLLIGESGYRELDYDDFSGPGRACLVFGPFAGTEEISAVGACWQGDGSDTLGYSVAGPGDVDGDGYDDLLLGGPSDDDAGEDAGAAWFLSGVGVHRP